MAPYVDHSTQTSIAGLINDPAAVPVALAPHADAITHVVSQVNVDGADDADDSPTWLVRPKGRFSFHPCVSISPSKFAESPRSPPPTQAPMSPLPAANCLHAGHTPIFPRSLSPLHIRDDTSGPATPDQEQVLSSPLTLPALPGNGTEDENIELRDFHARLEKLARLQSKISERTPQTAPQRIPENEADAEDSWKASTRRSSENPDDPDGVILKKPKMNFGQPLGQA